MFEGTSVTVLWDDAHCNLDEVDASDTTHRPWKYITNGILVRSDAAGVTIAQDKGEDGKFRTRTFIPRNMVVNEWVLGPVIPKQRKRKHVEKVSESLN